MADTQEDQRIANLLLAGAPPARDASFRLSVLERWERRRFHRRSALLLAAAVLAMIAPLAGLSLGVNLFAIAGVLAIGAGLAASYFLYAPAVALLLRRLRG